MEENSSFNPSTNGGFQYSFGNGATSENGVAFPFDATVNSLGLSSNSATTATVALYKITSNGGQTDTGARVALSGSRVSSVSGLSIDYDAGERLTFKTLSGSGGGRIVVSAGYSSR